MPVKHLNPSAHQQIQINTIEAADFLAAIGLQRGPIQPRGIALPAKTVRFFEALGKMRGVAVQFFGNTAHVDAGSTQAVRATSFGHRNPGPSLRSHAGRAHATATTADDKQVKVKRSHHWRTTVFTNCPGLGSPPP